MPLWFRIWRVSGITYSESDVSLPRARANLCFLISKCPTFFGVVTRIVTLILDLDLELVLDLELDMVARVLCSAVAFTFSSSSCCSFSSCSPFPAYDLSMMPLFMALAMRSARFPIRLDRYRCSRPETSLAPECSPSSKVRTFEIESIPRNSQVVTDEWQGKPRSIIIPFRLRNEFTPVRHLHGRRF